MHKILNVDKQFCHSFFGSKILGEHILWVLKKNWLHFLGTSEMFYVLVELTLLIHDESDA